MLAFVQNAKFSHKLNFANKSSLKKGYRFHQDNCYLNNRERHFLPSEIETRGELTRIGIKNNYYYPHLIYFDLLSNTRWQDNIEAKQGRFQLNRFRFFAFQLQPSSNMRNHDWFPYATDNSWAKCPDQTPTYEHHVIHTLG